MSRLQVYVSETCWTCQETLAIAREMQLEFPGIVVEVLDLADVERPEEVFAVPTYLLDGTVIYLGNPSREQLRRRLNATQEVAAAATETSGNASADAAGRESG